MKRKRLDDAAVRLLRLGASLEELEEILAARREVDRNPLQEYIFGPLPAVAAPARAALPPRRRLLRRTLAAARAGALPVTLAAAMATFGLVRLQPANTLWYQELTLTAGVETGEFACEPLKLTFAGLTHPAEGQTTLTYALSGGGTIGYDCPPKDISNLQIPVGTCFNPQVKPEGPVIAESHPGTGNTAWKYDAKNSSNPKLIKWDAQTEDPPLGGRGPFDPDVMRFSVTFNLHLDQSDLAEAMAAYKAGNATTDLGKVLVPACPLPEAPQPLNSLSIEGPAAPAPDTFEVEEEPEPEPEPEPEWEEEEPFVPAKPGPVSINGDGPKQPKTKPTPTPTPIGISIRGGGQ